MWRRVIILRCRETSAKMQGLWRRMDRRGRTTHSVAGAAVSSGLLGDETIAQHCLTSRVLQTMRKRSDSSTSAALTAASGVSTTCTPPFDTGEVHTPRPDAKIQFRSKIEKKLPLKPVLNLPRPRPPARTWRARMGRGMRGVEKGIGVGVGGVGLVL